MILDLGAISGISKKLLFLHGKQNEAITGGWEGYSQKPVNEEHHYEIGETLYVHGHYSTDAVHYPTSIVGTVDPISMTNVNSIHFRVLNLYSEQPSAGKRAWRVGVASVEDVERYTASYYDADVAKFVACNNSNTYTGNGSTDGVYTLDVSNLTGDYYVFLYASYTADIINGGEYLSAFEVDKILME